nr:helix-turn-helix transcriptional regulator [Curtanaerobium respiraculi]
MDEMGFGEILRQTRERKGLDLNATARRLRIRPDILRAIEAGNFAAMPPRGYTRNMITGYARYLGLNPTEITGMYLSELSRYENGISSSRRRSTGFDMSEAPENTRFPRRGTTSRLSSPEGRRASQPPSDRRRRTGRGSAYTTEGLESMQRSRGYNHGGSNYVYPDSRTRDSRGSVLPSSSFLDQRIGGGSGARGTLGQGSSKLPFIIAAAVILVIVILVSVLLFGGKSSPGTSAVSTLPVTGLSDSSAAAGASAASSTAAAAPTEGEAKVEVASGTSVYLELYVNGEVQVADTVKGPQSYSYTFTDSFQFVSVGTEGVTLTINGKQQELEENSNGIVKNTYEFSDILKQWQADNGVSTSSGSSNASSAKSSSTSASAPSDTPSSSAR